MEQKPFELRQQAMAESHRVWRRSIHSLRALHEKPAIKNENAFPLEFAGACTICQKKQ
jgi:hypothetical protein